MNSDAACSKVYSSVTYLQGGTVDVDIENRLVDLA